MPAYNAERFLREAVKSILSQTLEDWELIVVDDGSTDDTARILSSFTDPRVHVITHASNQGLVTALNAGVNAARGRYIARLDADDIALPERLERQVAFLDSHPGIGLLGTAADSIDETGQRHKRLWRPRHPVAVRFLALLETPLLHPTVMARAGILKDNPYDPAFKRGEDYDLWSRLMFDHNVRAANLSDPLVLYRRNPKGFTTAAAGHGEEFVVGIPLRNISRYLTLSERDRAVISTYRRGMPMTLGHLMRFAILLGTLAVRFSWREHPALPALPAIKRIVLGTFWRAVRRYRRGLKHQGPK